jgi:uroporphyrinogen decarboxylase
MPAGKPLIDVLTGRIPSRRPVWLMRQAGRYLPEYREVRAQAGSFLGLCDDARLASEVTLQPLRRYDLDAAIVFADILLVARALGSNLDFRDREGPVLTPIRSEADVQNLASAVDLERLKAVFETLALVKKMLASHQTLIGFCGGPWTVASYMIEGGSTDDRLVARETAIRRPDWFNELMRRLVEGSVDYLAAQVEAGAEVLQIFDSWAGDLPETLHEELIFGPVQAIISGVRKRGAAVPVIGFARGLGAAHCDFASKCDLAGISVEQGVPLAWVKSVLMPRISVQGNLDPLILAMGGEALDRAVRRITALLPVHSHVFNLGHGVRPETPPEHVRRLVEAVRQADGAGGG